MARPARPHVQHSTSTSSTDDLLHKELPKWPSEPTKIQGINTLEIFSLLGDAALLLLALAFECELSHPQGFLGHI